MSGILANQNDYTNQDSFGNLQSPPPLQWRSTLGTIGGYRFENRASGSGSTEEFFSLNSISGSQSFILNVNAGGFDPLPVIVEIIDVDTGTVYFQESFNSDTTNFAGSVSTDGNIVVRAWNNAFDESFQGRIKQLQGTSTSVDLILTENSCEQIFKDTYVKAVTAPPLQTALLDAPIAKKLANHIVGVYSCPPIRVIKRLPINLEDYPLILPGKMMWHQDSEDPLFIEGRWVQIEERRFEDDPNFITFKLRLSEHDESFVYDPNNPGAGSDGGDSGGDSGGDDGEPPPTLELISIDPIFDLEGGGINVTATVANASTDSGVTTDFTFNGISGTNITVVSPTEITCDAPSGTLGKVDITVTQDSESSTLIDAFEYVPAYVNEILSDNPIAYWRFEETSGPIALDATTNGNNGAVTGANLNVAGKVGSGVSFDGIDDFINVGRIMSQLSPFTFEFWFNSTSTNQGVLAGAQFGNAFVLTINESIGKTSIFIRDNSATFNFTKWLIDENIYDGAWHHLAITIEDASDESKIFTYVDGVSVTQTFEKSASANNWGSAESDLYLGAENSSGPTGFAEADIDELAIYHSVLSEARLQAHINAA